ncbi:hypothetical protein QL285_041569 [Trifolium repens]|jgi:hypothetical protein|nr:hypothetical protein QL285_041569 [Trifolium repens]
MKPAIEKSFMFAYSERSFEAVKDINSNIPNLSHVYGLKPHNRGGLFGIALSASRSFSARHVSCYPSLYHFFYIVNYQSAHKP